MWLFGKKNKIDTSISVGERKIIIVGLFKDFLNQYDFEVEFNAGDPIRLWNKEGTNLIGFYDMAIPPNGECIARFDNEVIANHLKKYGKYEGRLISLEKDIVKVDLELLNEYDKSPEEKAKERNEKTSIELAKPYSPKKSWKIDFVSKNKFDKNTVLSLGCYGLEKTQNELKEGRDIRNCLWLIDSEGHKISTKGTYKTSDTVKTLRAIYSGIEFELVYLKKEDERQIFEVFPKLIQY